jgi:hypothetical protein
MKQQHHPWDDKSLEKGANTDIEPEHVARTPGTYIDAQNFRLSSNSGADGALLKIGGEIIVWQIADAGQAGYVCIGTVRVKDTVVSFWAHPQNTVYPPLVTIDGVPMVKSFDLPYTSTTFLQLAKSEDCDYGLVFDARSLSIPLVFDIEAIVTAFNGGLQTYFADLDITQLQVNLAVPVNSPRYYGLEDLGPGGGMFPGNYWYAIRYANQDGDTTAVGPEVGPVYIPIFTNGPSAPSFPSAGLQGSSLTDVGVKTRYGAILKFRVNNKANFDRIQLIRIEYNLGGGIDAVPKTVIAKEWLIAPGQISVISYTDNGDGTEIIPADEVNEQRFYITRANSVRYINYRVVYGGVQLASRNIDDLVFREVGGEKLFPFTRNIGTRGHADPIHNCYHRSFMRGEKYGFGVQMYDPAAGLTFVTPVPDYEDYPMPNRRDPKFGDSALYSNPNSLCWAANTDTQNADRVTPTFEVFDHDTATGKSDFESVVNVMQDGARVINGMNPQIDGTGFIANGVDGIYGAGSGRFKTAYARYFRPVSAPDTDKFGLNYLVNPKVRYDPYGPSDTGYNPQVFNVNYHALGMGVYGISNFPDWVQGFRMVRTPPAGRVVMQGIATYWLQENAAYSGTLGLELISPATKSQYTVAIPVPDWDAGVVNETVIQQLLLNPQNYQIQMVSPLGFCSEQAAGAAILIDPSQNGDFKYMSEACDMISYARILWDGGQINPGNNSGGVEPTIPGPIGTHYTDFGSWRNTTPGSSIWHQPGQGGGNKLINIVSAGITTDSDGGQFLTMELSEQIYASSDPIEVGFNETSVKQWHEPFYAVNIVQTGAISDSDAGYESTAPYIPLRSVIGVYGGVPGQQFELIDEQTDDVLPGLSGEPCYIWVDDVALLCQNGLSAGVITNLANAIIASPTGTTVDPFGNTISGLYGASQVDDIAYVEIIGNSFLEAGDQIEVRYDPNIPHFFYGDTTTNPSIVTRMGRTGFIIPDVAPFDDAYQPFNNSGSFAAVPKEEFLDQQGTRFFSRGTPLPFPGYHMNPRYWVPYGKIPDGLIGPDYYSVQVNNATFGYQDTIRQWVIMFDCEMRAPSTLSVYEPQLDPRRCMWPQINYVQRPVVFDNTLSAGDNGTFADYGDTYPGEVAIWSTGGFRTNKRINQDYATQRGIQFFKKPEFGFIEQTDLCSAIIWSARAAPNVQNSPGLRTFPATNIYYIQNDTGDIQRLYSSPSGAGFNLYAITERGVVMVLVNKSVAYSADGSSFSLLKNDAFILDNSDLWISRSIGMPGDQWRTAAEGAAFLGSNTVRQESLFWWNGDSAFQLTGNALIDIAKTKYRKAIQTPVPGIAVRATTGIFLQDFDEYWCVVGGTVFVYSAAPGVQNWAGRYGYLFDQYVQANGRIYGMRDGEHWVLNSGYTMNGEPLEAWVKVATAKLPTQRMAWIRYKAITGFPGSKPSRVEFYDENDVLSCALDPSIQAQGSLYLKLEDGWEQGIPRKTTDVSPNRQQLQGRLAYSKTIHNAAVDFRVISVSIQYKGIK